MKVSEKKIFIEVEKGRKICAVLTEVEPRKAIVIICHGFSSSKQSHTGRAISNRLTRRGISTLRIDLFAHGESDGSFADLKISTCVNDILSVIKYVKKLGYARIGLHGTSFGGNCAIVAAAKAKGIRVLTLRAPVTDIAQNERRARPVSFAKWKQKGWFIKEGKVVSFGLCKDAEKNVAHDFAKRVRAKTIIVHGSADRSVPVEYSIRLAKLIPHCTLEVIKGADHNFSKPWQFKKSIELIADFIDKLL